MSHMWINVNESCRTCESIKKKNITTWWLYSYNHPVVIFYFNWFTCAPWLSTLRQDSFVCVTWLIRMCDMTRSHVRRDPFICVTRLIHVCVVTHSYDLFCYLAPIFVVNECVVYSINSYTTECLLLIHIHIYTYTHIRIYTYTHSVIRMSECVIHIGYMNECTCSFIIYWKTHLYTHTHL